MPLGHRYVPPRAVYHRSSKLRDEIRLLVETAVDASKRCLILHTRGCPDDEIAEDLDITSEEAHAIIAKAKQKGWRAGMPVKPQHILEHPERFR